MMKMSGGGGDGSISVINPTTIFDLDATQEASYSGSGTTWANLVTAPADGSDQTDWDFDLNTWDFIGTAGDAGAYFGTPDVNRGMNVGTNPDFVNTMHKTTGGNRWWFVAAVQAPSITGQLRFLSTASNSPVHGFLLQTAGAGSTNAFHVASNSYNNLFSEPVVNTAAIDYVGFDYNPLTGDVYWWIDSVNGSTGTLVSDTFTATTTDATGVLTMGAIGPTTSGSETTTSKYKAAVMGQGGLSNAEFGAIVTALKARHS
jgi:hypothetical protein